MSTRKTFKKIGIDGLSTLEADIMDTVWGSKKVTVREVHETMFNQGVIIPYTTVMAAMTTMAQKGLLKQNKNNKTYLYSAAISRESMAKQMVDAIVEKILGGNKNLLVLHLLKLKSDEGIEKILERL